MKRAVAVLVSVFAASPLLVAQQETKVPFSDEGRPRTLKVELLNGRITVRGYSGKEAIVTNESESRSKQRQRDRNGWIRIDNEGGLSLTEQNNTITIIGSPRHSGAITIQVPHETSLELRCTNCGETLVENIRGEIDVHSVNGSIRLMNVSGSILAYSLNRNIVAVIDRLDPNKPHSFSSMNGSIDCTFPADLKGNVKMRTENGKIQTDFDIRLGGGTVMRTDRGISGTIGGGGPDIQFKAFNGSIYIRKK